MYSNKNFKYSPVLVKKIHAPYCQNADTKGDKRLDVKTIYNFKILITRLKIKI